MSALALEMRSITKEFPGVRALDGVTFQVRRGEIHALVGENGAGKSTLMKVLSGFYPAGSYSGEIVVRGEVRQFHGIRDSQQAGIAIIYQELALVKEMTVGENIFLGHEPVRTGMIDYDLLYHESAKLLAQVGLRGIDPTAPVRSLGVGQQQLVEIAKALRMNAEILILDEPTAALTETEVAILLEILRNLRAQGVSCVYISHKLGEVFSIADSVTVLRDGRTVETMATADLTENWVVSLMVGRELQDRFPYEERPLGAPVLEVRNLTAYGAEHKPAVQGVSLTVRAGEVLGIAGLMGAGRTELVTAIFGAWPRRVTGEVWLNGKRTHFSHPGDALDQGIALVSEDRKRYGLVLDLDIKQNSTLSALKQLLRWGVIDANEEVARSRKMASDLKVKMPHMETPVNNLSGGNQQKVVLAKMLMTRPRVLILDEPTRGIDVGAKFEIYKIIGELARQGVTIIVVSSELPEVLGLSDRVLVMREGQVVGEFSRAQATQERIMHAATGGR